MAKNKSQSDAPDEFSYIRAAEMVFGTPQLIGETQGHLIGEYLSARMRGIDTPAPKGNRFVGDEKFETGRYGNKAWKGYRVEGTTAIVSLLGETVNRGAWMGSHSGMTSYEGFSRQMLAAAEDDETDHIVMDVNTPGGQTHGLVETSRLIRKIAQEKPVTAVVNATAFSAGMGLISGASRIVATESAELGSIGVLLIHLNRAAQLEDAGIKVTMFHAGARKIDLNPFKEISKDAAEAVRARMDGVMAQLTGIVSEHRGIKKKVIYGLEAGILSAQASIDVGLADDIGTLDEVLADLNSAGDGRKNLKRRQKMSKTNNEETVTKATHDAAVATAKTDGATEATTRFNDIIGHADIAGDAGRMKAAVDLANKSPNMSASDVCAFVVENVAKASVQETETKVETPTKSEDTKALASRNQKPDSLAAVAGTGVDGGTDGDSQPKAVGHARSVMDKINARNNG